MNEPHAIWNGLLVLDKPEGITSRRAVDHAARWLPRRTKLGHAGTLDPMASGVLVVCVGLATRLVEFVQRMGKTYVTDIELGGYSNTDDAEGIIQRLNSPPVPERQPVLECLQSFHGEVEQRPPDFSAARIRGQRAYNLARRGRPVALEARTVRIDAIRLLEYTYPHVRLEIQCGKGTYIRSLARDLGQRLGCGGWVRSLRRTRIGPFTADDAVPFNSTSEEARAHLRALKEAVAELAAIHLNAVEICRFRKGQAINVSACSSAGSERGEIEVGVFDGEGRLVAVGMLAHGILKPAKVLITPGSEISLS